MFLSRLRLHPRDQFVIRDLGDAAEMHRTLMRGFPSHDGESPRAAFRVLYRVETGDEAVVLASGQERARPPVVLVQSAIEPVWSRLPEGYALDVEHRNAGGVLDGATAGRRLRFRLVGNPTQKRPGNREGEAPPRHSRRYALRTDAERHEWLCRRGAAGGFRLVGSGPGDGVRISELRPTGRLVNGRAAGVYVEPVLFEGVLEIEDPERFRAALRDGVGPARAYGCGLLSVAPLG